MSPRGFGQVKVGPGGECRGGVDLVQGRVETYQGCTFLVAQVAERLARHARAVVLPGGQGWEGGLGPGQVRDARAPTQSFRTGANRPRAAVP